MFTAILLACSLEGQCIGYCRASGEDFGRVPKRHSLRLAHGRGKLSQHDRAGCQVHCMGRGDLMFSLARLKLYAIGAATLLAAFLGVYIQGRRDQSQKEDLKDAEDYIETRKRVDSVRIDDAEQWLRNRADKRDL